MTHSPGPWDWYHQAPQVLPTLSHNEVYRIGADDNTTIGWVPRDTQQDDDNARLIAAAPELLAACQAQHHAIDLLLAMLIDSQPDFLPSESGPPWSALLAGNAAIEKATGAPTC